MARRARREKPEIELYMYSLNQEFPARKGHATFLKRYGETFQDSKGDLVRTEQMVEQVYRMRQREWPAQWVHNQWGENWLKAIGSALPLNLDPFDRLLVREEEFGGIIFDPATDRIYRVNKAGYHLFSEMRKAHEAKALAGFRSEEFAPVDVEPFVSFLKGAGVWPT
jgi:hypothetical protein